MATLTAVNEIILLRLRSAPSLSLSLSLLSTLRVGVALELNAANAKEIANKSRARVARQPG